MSKSEQTVRELIVNKAIEMYNSRGVEYVGVRELAAALAIKGGNITYYFPTKNSLLEEIAGLLTLSNTAILEQARTPGLYGYLSLNKALFSNQYKYRGFLLSMPLFIRQDLAFAEQYRDEQKDRRKAFAKELKALIKDGSLMPLTATQTEGILGTLATIGRMWINEATLDGIIDDERLAVHTYMARMAGLIQLVATEKGKAELSRFSSALKNSIDKK